MMNKPFLPIPHRRGKKLHPMLQLSKMLGLAMSIILLSSAVPLHVVAQTPRPPTQAPVPIGPSDLITITRPTFSWSAVPGATTYTLYVIRVSDEFVVLRQTDITGTSFTPTTPLPGGIYLRWKVKGESSCGPGPYSPSVVFTIDTKTPCPPTTAPTPRGPSDTIADPKSTFSWTPVAGATSYTLYVLRVSDEEVVLRQTDITSTSFTPANPLPIGIDLRWKIKGESGCGPGPYSPSIVFRIGQTPCPPVDAPTPMGPSGTINNPKPTFSWSAVAGATTYTLYVLKVSDESVVLRQTEIAGTSFTPGSPLPSNIDLRLKVKGESSCGPGPYSPSVVFRIGQGPCPPTEAPTLIGPSGTISTATPTFSWTAVSGASSYTLYVLKVSDESVVLRQTEIVGTSFTPKSPLTANIDLRCKVKGESSCGPGPYSPSVNFRIEQDAVDTLPYPNHVMDFGYYFVDGRYGDYRNEVSDYTNLYYAWARRGYELDSTDPDNVWLPRMAQSLKNAVAENRKIMLALNLQENSPGRVTPLDAVLDLAAPYWRSVSYIELADEPNWTRQQTEARIADLRSRLQKRGLENRSMGVVYTRNQALNENAILANGLDWVGIEAYVDAPGSSDSQVNINDLTSYVQQAKARVPMSKNIVLIMMAYDRNGNWKNLATLADLQTPTYLLAYNDPRVIAITMFSYGRPGGTRDYPALKALHQKMGEKIFNFKPIDPIAWEDDNFDRLAPSTPLDGQNGWRRTASSDQAGAMVIPDMAGNILKIETASRKTITLDKDVPDQASGRHTFKLRAKVSGATSASVAKLELKTTPSGGYDKKFQIYFGNSMRINYNKTATTTLVNSTVMGQWYELRCEMDLDAGLFNVYVDNKLIAGNLKMHPGPITALSLTGYDRNGAVYLDDFLGFSQSTPGEGLPAPNHPLAYGYYFVDGKYGDQRDLTEVNGYTDLYLASRWNYQADPVPPDLWQQFEKSLQNAVAANRQIYLSLGEDLALWNDALNVAAKYWNNVILIELADEPAWSRIETENMLRELRTRLQVRGLPSRPIGVVYTRSQVLNEDALFANGLDWVGIEAYIDAPGSADSQVNVNNLYSYVQQAKARVPASKNIVLVMMAYDRNGGWKNIATLTDLQIPAYLLAYNDPRVIALTMFAYGRSGGTRDHPELKAPHKQIGAKILAAKAN